MPTHDQRSGAAAPAAGSAAPARAHDDDHANPLEVLEMEQESPVSADAPKPPKRRRRQWGAERPRPPLPAIEKPASTAATWLGGFAIVATVVMFVAYLAITIVSQVIDEGIIGSAFVWQAIAYVIVMGFLIFSTFSYLLARQGALYRSRDHVRTPRAEIDAFFSVSRPSLTALVPSYAEDPAVVRATLLSAALQEYPDIRVVLLLDDPPHPTDPAAMASLDACRAVPGEIQMLLAGPYHRFTESLARHEEAALTDGASTPDQVRDLGRDFRWAAAWLREQRDEYVRTNNADDFLADEVLGGLADDMDTTAQALFASLDSGAALPTARLSQPVQAPGVDVRCSGVLVRAQGVREPASRREQGDEPQRVPGPHGPQGAPRRDPLGSHAALHRCGGRRPHPGFRLRADARCGQRDPARVLPAPGSPPRDAR
ncbi:glycosyltransferase family 2 protein [Demequina litorisediminis]|uniref:Uncharacterized protein n=1 Tax=Demequina litorisediminis TaxID=1849022 RepID=A0ABQ6IIM6_9MICO|nr:glycosyltransferase family 2 protein [Demequina litorisediminis]GMA37571.1 hypothetical protein GCM10025876_37750 [Demequina litorisediminis]